MSVFNRKLFTHTPYHHYGTGIASGLVERQGFAVGGRVKLSKGGDSSFNAQAAIDQQRAETDKAQLFKGNESILPAEVINMSPIGRAYQINFNKFLKQAGVTPEQYKEFSKENKQALAENINDQVVEALMTEFNVGYEDIEKAFGGKSGEKGQRKMIKQSLKALDQTYDKGLLSDDQFLIDQQTKLNDRLAEIEENFPTARNPLPDVKRMEIEQEELPPPPPAGGGEEGLAAIASDSLMGRDQTTDEFREDYINKILGAREQLGINEKAKKQAMNESLLNIGAADPVQKGQSLIPMLAKSFKDPMKELYAAEAEYDKDVYDRYATRADTGLTPERPGAQVELAEYFMSKGVPQNEVLDLLTGATDRQSELYNNEVVQDMVGTYLDENPTASLADAYDSVLEGILPPKSLKDKTITAETLTAPNNSVLANGGRVGLNMGGQPTTNFAMSPNQGTAMEQARTEAITFEELRAQLPEYINDDVVRLLVQSPEALMDLAEAQTAEDLDRFEQKYNVQVTMPFAEDGVTTDGAL